MVDADCWEALHQVLTYYVMPCCAVLGGLALLRGVQVKLGELDRETFGRILGLTAADWDGPELPPGMGPEPE